MDVASPQDWPESCGAILGRPAERDCRNRGNYLADLEAAWDIGVSWRDQDFSIVDGTSFAVMRRLGIDRVASLDAHFAVFRFGPKHRQSFQVLK